MTIMMLFERPDRDDVCTKGGMLMMLCPLLKVPHRENRPLYALLGGVA